MSKFCEWEIFKIKSAKQYKISKYLYDVMSIRLNKAHTYYYIILIIKISYNLVDFKNVSFTI